MRSDVDKAIQRTQRYWYDDGLTEIAAGCLFAAIGGLFLAEALAPKGSLPSSFSAVGLVVLVAGGMWLAKWAVRSAKSRITYPRTGYVQYRRPPRTPQRRILAGVIGAGLSISIVLALNAFGPASMSWTPALQGLFIGGYLLFIGYSIGLARFYVIAAASLLIGASASLSLSGMGDTFGDAAYFLSMGLLLVLSGGLTLSNYLRSTRPSEGE